MSATTTQSDSDTGRDYDYDLTTQRTLWNNVWLLENGSGTESGKGWSSLTVDSNGTFTSTLSLPAPVTNLGSKPAKTLTWTTTGTSSDEMNHDYETTFTRTALGWSIEDSGSGTHKVKSRSETTVQGSDQNSDPLSPFLL